MSTRSLKLFTASSWSLAGLPVKYRAANGSTQVYVLVRCATKRRFVELLESYYHPASHREVNAALRHLNTYCSCNVFTPDNSQWERFDAIAVKPETVYYNPEHHCPRLGYVNEWFELLPHIAKVHD